MNNREIKFRALCEYETTNGTLTKMVYFGFPEMDNGLWAFPIDKQIRHINAYESPLMQYTGLKDKNGKEIYEGDIVKWGHTRRAKEFLHRVALVQIDPDIQLKIINYIDSFTKRIIPTDNYIFHWGKFAYNDKDLEIIGNIYENPTLIE